MVEYIDKKQAIDRIASCYCMDCEHSNGILCRACEHQDDMDLIDDMPTADVQPVKRGVWEEEHYNDCENYYCAICSECGYESTDHYRIIDNHRYCEYCGAKMIKDGEQK